LTSYHTIAADLKKFAEFEDSNEDSQNKKPKTKTFIFELEFHRIILDEAHIIRNSNTGFFQAMSKLQSKYKICLTGTPFVNRPEDIHSLLAFLNVQPLGNKTVFNKAVTEPIRSKREVGLRRIRATMAHVALRRSKAKVESTIELVGKTVQKRLVSFLEGTHKTVHDVLYQTSRTAFLGLLSRGDDFALSKMMALIELVLRVRQSCCHAALVPIERRERAMQLFDDIKQKGTDGGIEMDPEEAEELLSKLRGTFEAPEDQLEQCAICLEGLDVDAAVILRNCKHIFCEPCLNQVRSQCCPLCRLSYTPDDMIKKKTAEKAAEKDGKKKGKSENAKMERSPKIQAMLDAMEEMAPDEKGVIFCQWTSNLNRIELELQKEGHTYTRIDGTMSTQERVDAMEAFDTERCDSMRTPRFILCSLHACGTGINLTRGNVVFLMSPWWNNAAENQAMDRVHRIGQKRPVRVMRFLMKDTLEERMVSLQDAKAALGKGSLEKLSPDEKRKARLTAMKDLFEIEDVPQIWH